MPGADPSPPVRYTPHCGSLWSSSAPFSSSNKVQRSLPAAARLPSHSFIGSNAPAHLRRANVPADSTPYSTPAGRCSGLFGGSDRMTSRVTLPCGYVRYVGPARPLGWRAEHQTIAPPCEEAQVIRADVVWIRGTLDV